MAFQTDEEQPFLGYELAQGRNYSDATAARIDREVEHIIAARQEAVHQVLTRARVQLDTLADALLRDEAIREDALALLLDRVLVQLIRRSFSPWTFASAAASG